MILQNVVAYFCLILGLWSATEHASQTRGAPAILISVMISAVALSVLTLLAGSAVIAQLAGVVAGGLGAVLAVTLVFPNRVDPTGPASTAALLVGCFAAVAHFHLDVNVWHPVVTCLPFGLLATARIWPRIKNRWLEAALFGVASAAPLAYFLKGVFESAGPLY